MAGGGPRALPKRQQDTSADNKPAQKKSKRSEVIDLTAPCNQTASATPDQEREMWFGGSRSKVVGIQHYRGTVTNGENVILRREPQNVYDRNAVQVLNIKNLQVGHINRQDAALLATLMVHNTRAANE